MAKSKEMELAIKIAGKVSKSFGSALNQAKSGIASVAKSAASASASAASATAKGIGKITKLAGAATAAAASAVGAAGIAATKVGKEFESAMSQVSATMLIDKSTKEGQAAYATLEAAARECGRSTAFSASEAAEGLNYLALAGYDAEKAAAALPTVLNLAGAGAMELADASNMVTDAMSALGISATKSNLTSFADNLAMTASKSNTSVSELGEAILTVGGTAKYLAGGTTELSTCIGLLADNGIHASEGGTKLRNMITSLTAPTDKAAIALNELGVSAFDSEGNMRQMQAIFQDLNAAMAGMSTDQSSAVLSKIFNKTDLKAVNALLGTSRDRWDELSGAIANSAGACEDMYAIQLDNLEGDIKILQSGLSDLGISIYKDMDVPLREAVQTATGMVEELSNAYGEGGMKGMVSAVGGCLSEAVSTAADYAPEFISAGVDLLNNFISGIGSNSGQLTGAAVKALSAFISGLFIIIPNLVLVGADIAVNLAQGIAQGLPQLADSGGQAVTSLIDGLKQRLPVFAANAPPLVQALVDGVINNAPGMIAAGGTVIGGLISGVGQALPGVASAASGILSALVQGLVQALSSLGQGALDLVQGLVDAIIQNAPVLFDCAVTLAAEFGRGIMQGLPALAGMGVDILNNLASGISSSLPQMIPVALNALMAFSGSLRENAGRLVDAGLNLIMKLAQSIIDNIPTIIQTVPTIITNLCGIINDNAPKLLAAGIKLIVQLGIGLIKAIPTIIANIPKIIQAIVSVFTAFNWIQLGSTVIKAVKEGVISAAHAIPRAFRSMCNKAKDAVKNIKWRELGGHAIKSIAGGIKAFVTAVPKALKSIWKSAAGWVKNTDWLDLGVKILKGIAKGIVTGVTTIGGGVWNSIKGLFTGKGGGDSEGASSAGKEASKSYARGMAGGQQDAVTAANAVSDKAFKNVSTASAAAAGSKAGKSFSSAVNASVNENMSAAGRKAASSLKNGVQSELKSSKVSIGKIKVEDSGFLETAKAAGSSGAKAVGRGMADSSKAATQAARAIGNDVNAALDNGWDKANANAQSAMQRLSSTVASEAQAAANAVKSAFESLVITIPKPKIPTINASSKSVAYGDGESMSVPELSVSWNALGGIFNRPTIFHTRAGMQGVGEAGPEAVLPLDTLWAKMDGIISRAVRLNSGESLISTLIEKLDKIGGSGRQMEAAGTGGMTIQYSPVFNLHGSASKQEVADAEKISRAEFARMMKQYEKDRDRSIFRPKK